MNNDGLAGIITSNGPGIANDMRLDSGDSIEGSNGAITSLLGLI